MVAVTSREAKGVELAVRFQQECCWGLLIGDTRVASLPLPHHVYTVRVASERESVAAVGRPEVNSCDNKVLVLPIRRRRATAGSAGAAGKRWSDRRVLVREKAVFAH